MKDPGGIEGLLRVGPPVAASTLFHRHGALAAIASALCSLSLLSGQVPEAGDRVQSAAVTSTAVIQFSSAAASEALAPPAAKRSAALPNRSVPENARPIQPRAGSSVTIGGLNGGLAPKLTVSFPGAIDSDVSDGQGAVGPEYLVIAQNAGLTVQTRNGQPVSSASLTAFWRAVAPESSVIEHDPRVVYDPLDNRWISVALNGNLLVAASQTSDPTGGWFLESLDAETGYQLDFPTLAFTRDWVAVMANVWQTQSQQLVETRLYLFTKADLYASRSSAPRMFRTSYEVPARSYDADATKLYLIDYSAGVARVSAVSGPVGKEKLRQDYASYPSGSDAGPVEAAGGLPQMGTSQTIPNRSTVGDCLYRNRSIWCASAVSVREGAHARRAIEWVELDPESGTYHQVGRVDDATGAVSYAYPSIAVNRNNDVLLGYSSFSASRYPSADMAIRYSTDPAGELRSDVVIKNGQAPYLGSDSPNRGGRSATAPDPLDDLSFWTLQGYAELPSDGDSRYGLWWAQVSPPSPLLMVANSHRAAFVRGQPGAYDITVSNTAEAGATGGTVTLTETLPAGLTMSSMAGIGWSCSTETTYFCTRNDRLSAGSTYPPVTMVVNVSATAPATVTNEVSVAGGGSAVPATAVDHTTVSDPSLCDINADGVINVVDIQLETNEVLKLTPQTNDLNQDGEFNVSDVQIEVKAALGLGCSAVTKLTITSTTLPAGTQGSGYSETVTASGGTVPYNWSGTTGLPAGLSISSSGMITGTPTAAGTFTVDLKVIDSGNPAQTATANLSLAIQTGQLSLTTSSLPNGVSGSSYSQQLSAAGGVPPYSWTAAPLPAGLSLNSSTGVISGTPTTAGVTNVTIAVTDSSTKAQRASTTLSLTITAPGAGITVTSVTVGQNLQLPITITFSPALPSNATLTITSSDPTQVLLGSSGIVGSGSLSTTVDQGTTSVDTWVQASGSVGSVIDITAAIGGYTSGVGTVTIANSGFVVAGSNGIGGAISTYLGVTTTLTVYSARLNSNNLFVENEALRAGYSVNIPISSSATSVGTVSTPVAFSGSSLSTTTNFVAGSTTTGPTTVTVGPLSPFATPAAGGSILIDVQSSGLTPFTATIGNNLQTNVHVARSGNTATAVLVTITSPSPAVLFSTSPTGGNTTSTGVANPTGAATSTLYLNIPAGQTTTPDFYAHAYGSSGTVSCTVSATGYGTATATVTLAPSGLVILSPFGTDANFSTTVQTTADLIINTASLDGSGNPLALQAVAYGVSISASVAAANSNLGTVNGSPVTIATGFGADSSTAVTFTTATRLGTTAITATASGYGSASVNVTVNQQALLVSDDGGQAVGQSLEANGTVIVPGAASSSPIQILVQSNSPNLLLSTDNAHWNSNVTVTVAANTTSTTFYIESLASSGQGTITASTTADFGPGSDTISMVPSGILIYSTNTGSSLSISLSGGLTAPFTVFAAQLDSSDNFVAAQNAASILTVNFGNTNPAVGTFPSSLTIPVGTSTNTTGVFTPKATGSTNISVTQPAGFATPKTLASVAVTVNP
jgi:hypothetical protein